MISTDRLLLRDFEPDDWEAVLGWCSDAEVMRFMLAGGAWTEERSRAYVAEARRWAERRPRLNYGLAITSRLDGQVIGGCRLSVIDPEAREADLGFGLDRRFWGRGLATEAAQALLAFGFEQLGLHRVFAEPVAANAASVRVLEKLGMRREGLYREKHRLEDGWWDGLHYAILDREWGRSSPEPMR